MNGEENYPVGVPVPRVDSFEELAPDGPELTDEEKNWPVVAVQARGDAFEVVGAPAEGHEVVIRVRCAASATAAEVRAFAEKLRSAVEAVRPPAGSSPVEVSLPTQAS